MATQAIEGTFQYCQSNSMKPQPRRNGVLSLTRNELGSGYALRFEAKCGYHKSVPLDSAFRVQKHQQDTALTLVLQSSHDQVKFNSDRRRSVEPIYNRLQTIRDDVRKTGTPSSTPKRPSARAIPPSPGGDLDDEVMEEIQRQVTPVSSRAKSPRQQPALTSRSPLSELDRFSTNSRTNAQTPGKASNFGSASFYSSPPAPSTQWQDHTPVRPATAPAAHPSSAPASTNFSSTSGRVLAPLHPVTPVKRPCATPATPPTAQKRPCLRPALNAPVLSAPVLTAPHSPAVLSSPVAHETATRPEALRSHEPVQKKTIAKLRGLTNSGNMCYLAAALQQLFHSRTFVADMFKSPVGNAMKGTAETTDKPSSSELVLRLYQNVARMDRKQDEQSSLMAKLRLNLPQSFHNRDQHDAHEALAHLLDGMNDEYLTKGIASPSPPAVNFRFHTRQSLTCLECGVVSKMSDVPFWCFHLKKQPVPSIKSENAPAADCLNEMLERYFKPEDIERRHDDGTPCKGQHATAHDRIIQLPRICVMMMPRLEESGRKLGSMAISPTMDLGSFCDADVELPRPLTSKLAQIRPTESSSSTPQTESSTVPSTADPAGAAAAAAAVAPPTPPDSETSPSRQLYRLIGGVAHFGVDGFGHYISYIKTTVKDVWSGFSDAYIQDVSSDSALRDLQNNGYLLVYSHHSVYDEVMKGRNYV